MCTLWRRELTGSGPPPCGPWVVDAANEAGREGRTLLLELPLDVTDETAVADVTPPVESGTGRRAILGLVNVYTPNAGAELARLEYKTGDGGWDDKFRRAAARDAARLGGALVVGGDLNVAVGDVDFYNPREPRTKLQVTEGHRRSPKVTEGHRVA